MADLIDRAALLDDISAAVDNGGMGVVVAGTLKRYVKRSSTVDAVEVVRCKKCKYRVEYFDSGMFVCKRNQCVVCGKADYVSDNHFCSYGERREDNG